MAAGTLCACSANATHAQRPGAHKQRCKLQAHRQCSALPAALARHARLLPKSALCTCVPEEKQQKCAQLESAPAASCSERLDLLKLCGADRPPLSLAHSDTVRSSRCLHRSSLAVLIVVLTSQVDCSKITCAGLLADVLDAAVELHVSSALSACAASDVAAPGHV